MTFPNTGNQVVGGDVVDNKSSGSSFFTGEGFFLILI